MHRKGDSRFFFGTFLNVARSVQIIDVIFFLHLFTFVLTYFVLWNIYLNPRKHVSLKAKNNSVRVKRVVLNLINYFNGRQREHFLPVTPLLLGALFIIVPSEEIFSTLNGSFCNTSRLELYRNMKTRDRVPLVFFPWCKRNDLNIKKLKKEKKDWRTHNVYHTT